MTFLFWNGIKNRNTFISMEAIGGSITLEKFSFHINTIQSGKKKLSLWQWFVSLPKCYFWRAVFFPVDYVTICKFYGF